jgi:beta-glucosidase
VQLYVSPPRSEVRRPLRELRGFAKVWLEPGQSTRIELALTTRAYSYWDVETGGWVVAAGDYTLQIARSAHDVVLSKTVTLSDSRPAEKLTLESPVSAWLEHPVTGPIFRKATGGDVVEGGTNVLDMVGSMSMRRLLRFPDVQVSEAQLRALMLAANNPVVRGIAKAVKRKD